MADHLEIAEHLLNQGYGDPQELNEILVITLLGIGEQLRRIADQAEATAAEYPDL